MRWTDAVRTVSVEPIRHLVRINHRYVREQEHTNNSSCRCMLESSRVVRAIWFIVFLHPSDVVRYHREGWVLTGFLAEAEQSLVCSTVQVTKDLPSASVRTGMESRPS
jgi:hypothetical protein